jgi:hypothetical protein
MTIGTPLNILASKEANWKDGILPPDRLRANNSLKFALVSEPIVDYPRKDRPYFLIVDALTRTTDIAGGLGAILTQTDENGNKREIAYASSQLLKQEKK